MKMFPSLVDAQVESVANNSMLMIHSNRKSFSKGLLASLIILMLLVSMGLNAQIPLTNSPTSYSENFNSLNNNSPGSNVTWTNNSTIPGWFATESGYRTWGAAGDPSLSNRLYSLGSANGNTDRALGAYMTSTSVKAFGVAFTNNTGVSLSSLNLTFDIEFYSRVGNGTTFNVQYSTSSSNVGDALNSSNWTTVLTIPSTNVASILNQVLNITGFNLSNGSNIYIRFYNPYTGSSSHNTLYGIDNINVTWTPGATPATVTTAASTDVLSNAATLNGSIGNTGSAPVTMRGFAVGTGLNPLAGGAFDFNESSVGFSTGSFSIAASGLAANTLYHVRAYAISTAGTAYGNDLTFTTSAGAPSITTRSISSITMNSASSGGESILDGGASITAKGIVYSTFPNPVLGEAGVISVSNGTGTGNFTSNLSGLNPGTTYYVKAYATNSIGTGYGAELSFATMANYRSKQTGPWSDPGTWEVFNGTTWVDAVSTPTNADGTIQIQNGHEVTVASAVSADQLTIDAAGLLTVATGQTFTIVNGVGTDLIINGRVKVSGTVNNSGSIAVNATGIYQHDANANLANGISWATGSTCEITGITSGYEENGDLSNLTGNLYNLTWNCPGQGNFYMVLGNNAISILGKLKVVSTGSGILLIPASSQAVVQAGSFEQSGGIVYINRNASSGTRTFQVNGDVALTGNAELHIKAVGTATEGRLIVKGNFSSSSSAKLRNTVSSGVATLEFSGSSSQTASFGIIDGSGDIDLVLNNSNGLTLGTDCALTGNITLSNGKIHTGSNTISIPSDGTTNSFSSTKYINGKFGKGIGSGTTSKTFEIGDATNYTPVTISFSGTTNGSGSLVASTTATDHPDLSNSGINASKSVNRYFSVENNGVSGFSSFNITMNYAAADVDAGATTASFKVRKYSTANIPSWIAPASVSVGSNSITATGFNSFSDFAIGEVAIPTTTSIMNVTATYGDGVVTLTAGIIPPDATGLIHFFVDCLEVGTGMNAGGTATFDLDPSALTVGNHVIRAEYYTDGTYESSVSENGELTIHPKQLTVTIAANDKEYDGSTNAVVSVGSVSGIIGSEDVSVVASNGQFIDKNVGNGKEVSASLALAGADKDNYTIDLSAITTASISAKAVTISIAADNKPYDGNTSATVTALYPVTGVVAGDDVIASASNGQFASADAGNGIAVSADVAAAGDDAGNYTFNNTASTTADITKADATIVVNGYTGMYDGNEHGASLVSAVGVNNEDLAASVDLGSKYKNVGVENAGWTFSNKNYNAQADAVEIEITPAELIVTVNNASKLCGQADPVFTGMITGAVGLEVFTATYTAVGTAIAAAINENTDNYDVVIYEGLLSITGVSIDASASSNPVKLGDIAKLSATVSPVAANVKVSFYLNDVLQCAVMTNASGIATKDITGLAVGVYKVKAIVGDDCAESIAYLPVYDPSGGFVTGGGWILSPAGAYVADAALTGKANFGFNAKYKKGSNAVDGNTEFQFQAGNLNFKSTENTAGTLVIAGAKANFKGKGSINGVAGYSFMVSGIDGDINGGGGTDKFRIKIWNTASSELVYDNNLGFDENSVPTTCLGGGSIVIHEVKAGGKTSQKVDPDLLVTSLDARVFNNPAAGASTFRLKVLSPDADQKISLRIVDMSGKSLDQMQGLSAGQTVEFGAMYKTGMYVAEILQNGQRKLVKLVKQ